MQTESQAATALITNDAVVLGLLAAILALVFWTSSLSSKLVGRFYAIFPPILLCYFLPSLLTTFGVGFGAVGLSHAIADPLSAWFGAHVPIAQRLSLDSSFFWLVLVATLVGVVLSFTGARRLQGAGAAKVGSLLVYVLVATVGLNMNIGAVLDSPAYFLIGGVWMLVHVALMIGMAFLIRAPSFFLGVGSMANIGGAASAPVAAAAFHPSLAPVGVLLAVVGYIIGTAAAWFTGLVMMQIAAGAA